MVAIRLSAWCGTVPTRALDRSVREAFAGVRSSCSNAVHSLAACRPVQSCTSTRPRRPTSAILPWRPTLSETSWWFGTASTRGWMAARSSPGSSAEGERLGDELAINLLPAGSATSPSVAMTADGDFVVAWTDAETLGVLARRYNAAGQDQGDAFRVGTDDAGGDDFARVAITPGGDFVVCWMSDGQDGDSTGIFARRYNAAGIAREPSFRSTRTPTTTRRIPPSRPPHPAILLSWRAMPQDGSGAGAYAAILNAAGATANGEFRVNTTTAEDQFAPAGGGHRRRLHRRLDETLYLFRPATASMFVVQRHTVAAPRWAVNFRLAPARRTTRPIQRHRSPAEGLSSFGRVTDRTAVGRVFARQYDALGVAIDGEIQINSSVTGDQSDASVAANAAGDFVVTWRLAAQTGGPWGIYVRSGSFKRCCPCRRYPWSRTSPSLKAMRVARFLLPRSHSPANCR